MKTILDEWNRYRTQVMPVGAGPIQIQETERTFYAAVYSTLLLMREEVAALPDDEGVALLESWHQECRVFAASVK